MSNQVVHFQSVGGLGARTACGRSLHGWSRDCPENVTEQYREVTCKRCHKGYEAVMVLRKI